MPSKDGRFLGMSVPASAKWPPDRSGVPAPTDSECTCPGRSRPPAYHVPGCPVEGSASEENRRSGRW